MDGLLSSYYNMLLNNSSIQSIEKFVFIEIKKPLPILEALPGYRLSSACILLWELLALQYYLCNGRLKIFTCLEK